jgi:hypothetical protein
MREEEAMYPQGASHLISLISEFAHGELMPLHLYDIYHLASMVAAQGTP